jgi:hypothetical protein
VTFEVEVEIDSVYNNIDLTIAASERSLSQPRKDMPSDKGVRRLPLVPTSLMAVQHRQAHTIYSFVFVFVFSANEYEK